MSAVSVAEAATQPSALSVLVAEDVDVNRELVRHFLERRGHRVDCVSDGDLAVQAVRRNTYDLVIMDMHMPVMDGLEATQHIRGLSGSFETLPILALSANIIPDQIKRCIDAGMTAHLGKPFSSEQLNAAVDRLCDGPVETKPGAASPTESFSQSELLPLLKLLYAQIEAFETRAVVGGEQLALVAHALRGSAGIMGFAELAARCHDLERAAGEGADWSDSLVKVERAARDVKRSLRRQIGVKDELREQR